MNNYNYKDLVGEYVTINPKSLLQVEGILDAAELKGELPKIHVLQNTEKIIRLNGKLKVCSSQTMATVYIKNIKSLSVSPKLSRAKDELIKYIDDDALASNLTVLRVLNSLTIDQLSNNINIESGWLKKFEAGRERPSSNLIKKFCEFYNVSEDELLNSIIK